MITAFPKIFSIGTDYIRDIFKEPVEITEKIDGSQFAFGKINGELVMRSKGKIILREAPEKMFIEAVSYVEAIEHRLPDNVAFYCEYLKTPKHNTLAYKRIPHNHLMLFGVKSIPGEVFSMEKMHFWADELNIERIPLLGFHEIHNPVQLAEIIESESTLGGAMMEGVVVKNYRRQFLLGGQPMPLMAGKFVSEAFKEVHRKSWGKEHTGKGKLETFFESFCTEARWEKSVQHLRDNGELLNDPKDIGQLIKAIHLDIEEEEKEAIKNFLWHNFNGELKRSACKGFPEWYKKRLVERSF